MLVLILRPDRQDFQGTAVTVEVARKLEVPQLLLVVNKALPSMDFAALRQRVGDTYNAPVAGDLPVVRGDAGAGEQRRSFVCTTRTTRSRGKYRTWPGRSWPNRRRADRHEQPPPGTDARRAADDGRRDGVARSAAPLVLWLLRHGEAGLAEATAESGLEEAAVHALLETLVGRGFLYTTGADGAVRYKTRSRRAAPRRRHPLIYGTA